MTMFERWRVQVCLDSRGSDSYFILYVNKDGAATGAGQTPPRRGAQHYSVVIYTYSPIIRCKNSFYKKIFEKCRKYLLLLADCWLV